MCSTVRHLVLALQQISTENDLVAKSHIDLANLLRDQEAKVGEFLARRDGGRRLVRSSLVYCFRTETNSAARNPIAQQQTAVEKAWKNKIVQESFVNKVSLTTLVCSHSAALLTRTVNVIQAKAKYESDCIIINTLHAQAAVSQGRELDKVRGLHLHRLMGG